MLRSSFRLRVIFFALAILVVVSSVSLPTPAIAYRKHDALAQKNSFNDDASRTSNGCAQVREDPRDARKTYDIRRSTMDVHHRKIWLEVETYTPINPSDLGSVPQRASEGRQDGHEYTFEAGLVTQRSYRVGLYKEGRGLTAVVIDNNTLAEGGPVPHRWPEYKAQMLDNRTVAFHVPLQLIHHPIRGQGYRGPKDERDPYDTIAWSFSIAKEIPFRGDQPCWECFESAPDTAANEAGDIGAVGYLYRLDLFELGRDQPLRSIGRDERVAQEAQPPILDLTELLLGREGERFRIRIILDYPVSRPELIPRTLPPYTSLRWRFRVGKERFVVDAIAESAQAPSPVFTLWKMRKDGLENMGEVQGSFDPAESNWVVDFFVPISKLVHGKWRGTVAGGLPSSERWDAASFARLSADSEHRLDDMKTTEEFTLC